MHINKIKLLVFLTFTFNIAYSTAQENTAIQGVPKNADTLKITQLDGTVLDIVGFGSLFVAYTETIDGYTVVRNNKGIFEYAKSADDGDLLPSGVQAHNPGEREKDEIKYLSGTEKHMRYKDPKLTELKKRKDKFIHKKQ